MDLDVAFGESTMKTPIYIKMDAPDQLLLSEGVCRQLGIITYHPDVQEWRGGRKQPPSASEDAKVPTVRVRLYSSIQVPPLQSTVVQVQVDSPEGGLPVCLEQASDLEEETGLRVLDSVVVPNQRGIANVLVSNPSAYTQVAREGFTIGEAMAVDVIGSEDSTEGDTTDSFPSPPPLTEESDEVRRVRASDEDPAWRKEQLLSMLHQPTLLNPEQRQVLFSFLTDHHDAFSLGDFDRGETDWLELHIDTGDAAPRKQAARRMPFAVRQEVARQLQKMQDAGVVQPSSSPWASPVVMVQKKDGTHRFCVDYRSLNQVTKPDTFPLPRIDDLLDQLGKSKYFTTLDLASGFWQIRVHPDSQEKTAFVTPQGLFEFRVMPFGLTNAPSVFQRLMQRVLMGLNPEEGPDFVAVYIDDVLVFSRTLGKHIEHLCKVIERLQEAGLKLKPSKCEFVREEVEYLGHLITPSRIPSLWTLFASFLLRRT